MIQTDPTSAIHGFTTPAKTAAASASLPVGARLLFALLERLAHGAVCITTPDGHRFRFGNATEQAVDLFIADWALAREVLTGGDVAFAEAYIDGRWGTSDLPRLLTVLARNQAVLTRAFYGGMLQRVAYRLRHWTRRNTREQARRNVAAHYDLGNDFYRLWLDPTMTYSSALFEGDPGRTLEVAQAAKYDRILAELALAPGAHILEIGCGWGGFAECAARRGYRVTGISLSSAQTEFARARLARAGLGNRAHFHLRDYRDERGRYDGVASIEMFEAVGEKWWPSYFGKVRETLAPGGRACIQTITIADDRFEQYRAQSDFIQQYIFPGGMLASASRFAQEADRAGLAVERALRFGRDYAETLRRWLGAFEHQIGAVRAQGFDERFIRCWRFYLAYCTAGFDSDSTDVGQFTLVAR
ncbi:MAG: cyclopropane-fatty-acyl-phospholipid synthase family protein [Betaproteobacteria bacterium]